MTKEGGSGTRKVSGPVPNEKVGNPTTVVVAVTPVMVRLNVAEPITDELKFVMLAFELA
jgi:hypothetical protein